MLSRVYLLYYVTATTDIFYMITTTLIHEELLLRLQMNIADATAQVTAPSARYRFRLS
jgi:hypothetical protein